MFRPLSSRKPEILPVRLICKIKNLRSSRGKELKSCFWVFQNWAQLEAQPRPIVILNIIIIGSW